MKELKRRKELIKRRMGSDALKVLSDAGINVGDTIDSIIKEQLKQEAVLKMQIAYPSVSNTMTSELVYLSAQPEDLYGIEHTKRLRLLDFSDDKIQDLYQSEKGVLNKRHSKGREQPWVQRYFITQDITPEIMPKPEEMTLSELILITDDANSAFWRDHEWLPEKAWRALRIAASCAQYTEARYVKAFNERIGTMNWSNPQRRAYIRNECLLTERLKWGMHQNPAWSKETTDLKKYGP